MQVLEVRIDGQEPFKLTVDARDTLVWEKTSKPPKTFLQYLRDPDMVNLYRIAHIAGTRKGLLAGMTLQEFEKGADVVFDEEDDDNAPGAEDGSEPDPTQ